jgi:hypothetical protein
MRSAARRFTALGIHQPTAWFMLQRIRYALETQNFEKLSGTVEADETFLVQHQGGWSGMVGAGLDPPGC